MSMGFMVAMAGRKRDERGRYLEGDHGNRMDGGRDDRHDGNRGNDGNYSRMEDSPEMRRRRDSRGRYMEDDGGSRMEYDGHQGNYSRMDDDTEMRRRRDSRGRYMEGGASAHYVPWPEPHMPPYGEEPEMSDDPDTRSVERRRMEVPVHMRDRNIVNIRDYQDKRRIGFGENRMHHGSSDHGARESRAGGTHSMSAGGDRLTREKAEKWVRRMHSDDPKTHGEMWTYEDAKRLAEERDLPTEGQDMVDFYVALNMVYSDYCKVAKEYGVDTEDYYADLAQAWLYDRDGKPPTEKLMAYKQYVVPHGEE